MQAVIAVSPLYSSDMEDVALGNRLLSMDNKIVNEWEFYVEVGGVAAAYKDHPSN